MPTEAIGFDDSFLTRTVKPRSQSASAANGCPGVTPRPLTLISVTEIASESSGGEATRELTSTIRSPAFRSGDGLGRDGGPSIRVHLRGSFGSMRCSPLNVQ